jgi:hypothetical protein
MPKVRNPQQAELASAAEGGQDWSPTGGPARESRSWSRTAIRQVVPIEGAEARPRLLKGMVKPIAQPRSLSLSALSALPRQPGTAPKGTLTACQPDALPR